MANTQIPKSPSLSWSYTKKNKLKSRDFISVLWIFAVATSLIIYIFSESVISAFVIIAAAAALSAHFATQEEKERYSYTLTTKGLRVNNILFPFSSMKRYKIMKDENGKEVLAIDLISILTPDMVIPLDGVDVDDIDFFMSQFVKEDEDMPMPWTHSIAKIIGM